MKYSVLIFIMSMLFCIGITSAQDTPLIPSTLEPITLNNLDRLVELATIAPSTTTSLFNYPFRLEINADNSLLAGTNFQRNVWYWDLQTGEITVLEENNLGDVSSFIAFNPVEPAMLATCLGIWNLKDRTFVPHTEGLNLIEPINCDLDATFNPDGTQLVVSGRLVIYNIFSGDFVLDVENLPINVSNPIDLSPPEPLVLDIDYSPDGTLLAYTSRRGQVHHVRIIDVDTEEVINLLYGLGTWEERFSSISFSPDSTLLAVGRGDAVTVWDLEANSEIAITDASFNDVEFSVDGELVFIADEMGFRAWQYAINEMTLLSNDDIFVMTLSNDKRLIAMLDANNIIHLWGVPVEN